MKRFRIRITLFFLFAFFCLVFSFFYQKMHSKPLNKENVLEESFMKTGASLDKYEMYLWAELGSVHKDSKKLQELLGELVNSAGLGRTSVPALSSLQNEEIIMVSGNISGNGSVRISANSGGEDGKYYISIDLEAKEDKTGIEQAEQGFRKVLAKHGIKPRVSSCMVGSFDGRLDVGKVQKMITQVLNDTKAKVVEGMSDGNLTSISAFSPLLEESILVGGKKVNINIAARYNGYEDRTYIWLGVPVITMEY